MAANRWLRVEIEHSRFCSSSFQKLPHTIGRHVGYGQAIDRFAGAASDRREQQPQSVTVTPLRVPARFRSPTRCSIKNRRIMGLVVRFTNNVGVGLFLLLRSRSC